MYCVPPTCRVLPLLCWVSQHCTFTTNLLLTSPLGPTQILQTISSLCLHHVSIYSTFLLLSFNVSYPQLEYKHSAPKVYFAEVAQHHLMFEFEKLFMYFSVYQLQINEFWSINDNITKSITTCRKQYNKLLWVFFKFKTK